LPLQKTVAVVKPQNARGDLSDVGLRLDNGTFQLEVFPPSVYPWIKEPTEFIGLPQDRPNVAAFLAVAEDTGYARLSASVGPSCFILIM
jgi:hypothetical protein